MATVHILQTRRGDISEIVGVFDSLDAAQRSAERHAAIRDQHSLQWERIGTRTTRAKMQIDGWFYEISRHRVRV